MVSFEQLAGRKVHGWELVSILGKGADGIVYLATKEGLKAAVKLFLPESLQQNGLEQTRERVDLQLQLKGKKHHDHLVEIFEGGEVAELETLYLVMEYVEGNSLDKVIRDMPADSIHPLFCQLADAAKFLETKGLVHRDIKPANVVISNDFSKLTLLDLGIIMPTENSQEADRLSGDEFVASLRYSPPEFVWRVEGNDMEAGRAITFYQIGATLHDVIMQRPLFTGYDKPRAELYDSVRFRSPEIKSDRCEKWLVELAKSCLIKNWRERLNLVCWDSFTAAPILMDSSNLERTIRLRQIRNEELDAFTKNAQRDVPQNARIQALWSLKNGVFLEIRQYLLSSPVFPRFNVEDRHEGNTKYAFQFKFETAVKLGFDYPIIVTVALSIDAEFERSTDLQVNCVNHQGVELFNCKWTEMLDVESSFKLVRQSLMQIADKMVAEREEKLP